MTETGESDVPLETYREWVSANSIDVVMTDNLYQFEELAALRADGVKTIGRFVWEHFSDEHVAGAKEALDVIYSLHRGEQARYAELGIESPYVVWGCHPPSWSRSNRRRVMMASCASWFWGSLIGVGRG